MRVVELLISDGKKQTPSKRRDRSKIETLYVIMLPVGCPQQFLFKGKQLIISFGGDFVLNVKIQKIFDGLNKDPLSILHKMLDSYEEPCVLFASDDEDKDKEIASLQALHDAHVISYRSLESNGYRFAARRHITNATILKMGSAIEEAKDLDYGLEVSYTLSGTQLNEELEGAWKDGLLAEHSDGLVSVQQRSFLPLKDLQDSEPDLTQSKIIRYKVGKRIKVI